MDSILSQSEIVSKLGLIVGDQITDDNFTADRDLSPALNLHAWDSAKIKITVLNFSMTNHSPNTKVNILIQNKSYTLGRATECVALLGRIEMYIETNDGQSICIGQLERAFQLMID